MTALDLPVFQHAISDCSVGMVVVDAGQQDQPIVYVNRAFTQLTGFTAAEAIGQNCRFLQANDRKQPAIETLRKAVQEKSACEVTLRNYRKDRSFFWNEVTICPVKDDDGKVRYFLGLMRDVTERVIISDKLARIREELHAANIRLEDLAQHDTVTGIYNRRYFERMLRREWRIARRHAYPLSMIMFDIDNFKIYNDTFGHQFGDRALKRVGQTIGTCLRRAGEFAARYGGEEFVALMINVDGEEAYLMGLRICEAVRELEIKNPAAPSPVLTISGGIATARPEARMRPATLLEAADGALYQAKISGKDRVVAATPKVKSRQPES